MLDSVIAVSPLLRAEHEHIAIRVKDTPAIDVDDRVPTRTPLGRI